MLLYKLQGRHWVNRSGPAEGKYVSAEEILVESVIFVVNLIPQFFLRNNTFSLHLFWSWVLEFYKVTYYHEKVYLLEDQKWRMYIWYDSTTLSTFWVISPD